MATSKVPIQNNEFLLGTWQSFITFSGIQCRLIINFRKIGKNIAGWVDSPDQGVIQMPLKNFSIDNSQFYGEIMFGGILKGTLAENKNSIVGSMDFSEFSLSFELIKNHPDFNQFSIPQVNQDGTAKNSYDYQVPEITADGWQVSSLQKEGINSTELLSLMNQIYDNKFPRISSILIARNGKLVFEEYFYGNKRDKIHTLQSSTKSITSILIGIALNKGKIKNTENTLEKYLTDSKFGNTKWMKNQYPITLHQILSMSAGLDWNEELPYTDTKNDNTAMNNSKDAIDYILNRDLSGIPGQKFRYQSGLTILLGEILKSATGVRIDKYAEKNLFSPLNIQTYYWTVRPDGVVHTGGGLVLKPRDWMKIGQLMLNLGVWNSTRIISEDWVKISTSPLFIVEDRDAETYGYQWWRRSCSIQNQTVHYYYAAGYGGQFLFIIPELNMVVSFNATDFEGDGMKPFERLEQYIIPAALQIE